MVIVKMSLYKIGTREMININTTSKTYSLEISNNIYPFIMPHCQRYKQPLLQCLPKMAIHTCAVK